MASAMSAVSRFVPSLDGPNNLIRDTWDRLSKIPGGKQIFSKVLGIMAPYTGTIGCQVREVRLGYCRVELADRRAVRNHLQCVHAIAIANLAEVCGNVGLAYSLPDDARFIVAGISVEYVKKARGTITATSHSPIIPTNERQEFDVPVEMHNQAGELVATATLRTLVGPKKRS